ncbi:MAG: putative secreted protein [Pseudonocardia sp.]|nr:putative secreted protein [Pseudonocardia sp.]
MRRIAGLLLAVLALVAAGCGSSQPAATAESSASAASADSTPARVEIDKIAAKSSLIALGKLPSGEIETPDVHQPLQAGWYSRGVVPGRPGPAVILGHVDGGGKAGIFKRLHELAVGDEAKVIEADGKVLTFKAYDVRQVPKDAFPTSLVYGNTPGPELRLITCGGDFVGGNLGYGENVIVFLKLESST